MREHGTYSCYVWGPEPGCLPGRGCRCDDCGAARRAHEKNRRTKAAPAYVGAARARQHVQMLTEAGVGLKQIVKVSGISQGGITKLMYGGVDKAPSKRIKKATEDALLAVTPADAADGSRIDGTAYRADVATLRERGWTGQAIADAIGVLRSNFYPDAEVVTAGKARAVHALLDQPVPPRLSRWGEHHSDYDPEAERRDKMRRAAQAEQRADHRATARGPVDDLPRLDPDIFTAEWRRRSACRLLAADERWIFWPGLGDGETLAAAKAVCATCPVVAECLAFAIEHGEEGVWGGTSGAERRKMPAAA